MLDIGIYMGIFHCGVLKTLGLQGRAPGTQGNGTELCQAACQEKVLHQEGSWALNRLPRHVARVSDRGFGFWVRSQGLDSVVPVGPIQHGIFCGSVVGVFVCVAHSAVCLQKKEVTATVREEQYAGFEILGEVGISQIGELDPCVRKISSESVSWNLLSSYLWVPWSEQQFKPSKLLCKEDWPSQDRDSSRQRREFFVPSQQ